MRKFRLCVVLVFIALRRFYRQCLRRAGEAMRRRARALIAAGQDDTPRWSIELFHRCDCADVEFHVESHGGDASTVYRGPIYAVRPLGGDSFAFCLNWVARRPPAPLAAPQWQWGGAFSFIAKKCRTPWGYEGGDVCFFFEGGYAVLFVGKRGKREERLRFAGAEDTFRIYAYF